MKDAEYYMDLPYRMEIVKADNEAGYTVSFPELRGCLTSGMTIQDAVRNARGRHRNSTPGFNEEFFRPVPDQDSKGAA